MNPYYEKMFSQRITIATVFKTYLRTSPIKTSFYLFFNFILGIVPIFTILVNAQFINYALKIVGEPSVLPSAIRYAVFIILLMIVIEIGPNINNILLASMNQKVQYHLEESIINKVAALEYKDIENTKTLDLINRISQNPEELFTNILKNIVNIVIFILSCIGPLMIMFINSWISGLAAFILIIPFAYFAIKSGRVTYEARIEVTQKRRTYQYLSTILSERESTKERTLFGYGDAINEKYKNDFEAARKVELRPRIKWYLKSGSGGILSVILTIIVMLSLLNPVLGGQIEIGMFTSLITYFASFVLRLSWELPDLLYNFTRNREIAKDLTKFSQLKIDKRLLAVPEKNQPFDSLEFKNVTFCYPGTTHPILKDLSFYMEKGKHYAFVGENGVGKTTITKLITGLYSDFTGQILINGKDIRQLTPAHKKGIFVEQYQDYARYSISLMENISIGDVQHMEDAAFEKKIKNVIQEVGLTAVLSKLPEGLHTRLGKIDNDSIDLSGGEWQRVAMARTAISPAPFKILDEPTAALDPIQENYVYRQFMQMHKNSTTLLISHRLGSVKNADVIFVLSQGRVIQMGNHEQLIGEDGLYRTMYEKQKEWYI